MNILYEQFQTTATSILQNAAQKVREYGRQFVMAALLIAMPLAAGCSMTLTTSTKDANGVVEETVRTVEIGGESGFKTSKEERQYQGTPPSQTRSSGFARTPHMGIHPYMTTGKAGVRTQTYKTSGKTYPGGSVFRLRK